MATSDSFQNLQYVVPGGCSDINDFRSMCDWYMNIFFPDWLENNTPKGVYLVPPLPLSMPPNPPEGSSGGQKSDNVGDKQYINFRTGQKSKIEEFNFVQKIQKYAVENELPMFIFHGLAVDKLQWDMILAVAKHEMPSQCLVDLRNSSKIKLNHKGFPENLEIDCMTIDPKNGVVLWEIKSRSYQGQATKGLKKINQALKQLNRDELFVSCISKHFCSSSHAVKTKKIVVLLEDKISADENLEFENFREISADENLEFENFRESYKILDASKLGTWESFSNWFRSEIEFETPSNPEQTYKTLVPIMVGISVSVSVKCENTAEVRPTKTYFEVRPTKTYFENLSHAKAVQKLDSEISEQKLSRDKKPFSDLVSTSELSFAKTSKSSKLLFLTPRQQDVLSSSNNGTKLIIGPAGTGKTILTLHKIINLCKTQPEDKILLLCSGKFIESYCKMLEDNEISCERLMMDGRCYKEEKIWKREYLTRTDYRPYKGKVFEFVYEPLSSDLQTKQSINTKAFGQKQVIIGETTAFLNSLNEKAKQFVLKKTKKTNVTEDYRSETSRWVMKTHLVIDDCDLPVICESQLNPLSLLTSDQFLTWLVTDIHQSNKTLISNITHIKKLRSSKSVEVFILEEVLRNTVQINQMTRRLVEYMNRSLEDDGHVYPGTLIDVKQGSNFQGPPITIFELKKNIASRGLYPTKLIAFLLCQMMKEGMQAGDIHFLTSGEGANFFKFLGKTIRLEYPELLSQLGVNDETEVDWSSFCSQIYITKSSEWERVIIDGRFDEENRLNSLNYGKFDESDMVSKFEFRRPKIISNRLKLN